MSKPKIDWSKTPLQAAEEEVWRLSELADIRKHRAEDAEAETV